VAEQGLIPRRVWRAVWQWERIVGAVWPFEINLDHNYWIVNETFHFVPHGHGYIRQPVWMR
jgi:hypothetical protein